MRNRLEGAARLEMRVVKILLRVAHARPEQALGLRAMKNLFGSQSRAEAVDRRAEVRGCFRWSALGQLAIGVRIEVMLKAGFRHHFGDHPPLPRTPEHEGL